MGDMLNNKTNSFHRYASYHRGLFTHSLIINRANLKKLGVNLPLTTDDIYFFLSSIHIKEIAKKLNIQLNEDFKLSPKIKIARRIECNSVAYNRYSSDYINLIFPNGDCFCSRKSFLVRPNYNLESIDVYRNFNRRDNKWSQKKLIKSDVFNLEIIDYTDLYLVNDIEIFKKYLSLNTLFKDNAPEHREQLSKINSNFELRGSFVSSKSITEYQCKACGNIVPATPNEVLRGLKCSVCNKD